MERDRFSFIAHGRRGICNPLSIEKIEEAVARAVFPLRARAVDIGCGKGELLIRLAQGFGLAGEGIERSARFAGEARRRVDESGAGKNVRIHESDAGTWLAANAAERFDLACCLGSSHALGGYEETVRALMARVNSGGYLLLAEGFWAQRPSKEYLAVLGGDESEMTSHAANVERAIALGLVPIFATTAGAEEWDDYEWTYSATVEDFVREHPDDPDTVAMLARIRPWRDGYLRWGRDTLGFGLYLFRNP
ncbi:MAG TPA: class I SAM-dependent methyltransferase [Phycisphaerales bacterium]|nr:class I SAM-dependent methyltransferase [Phycisphaerales bacterium]